MSQLNFDKIKAAIIEIAQKESGFPQGHPEFNVFVARKLDYIFSRLLYKNLVGENHRYTFISNGLNAFFQT